MLHRFALEEPLTVDETLVDRCQKSAHHAFITCHETFVLLAIYRALQGKTDVRSRVEAVTGEMGVDCVTESDLHPVIQTKIADIRRFA